MFEKQKLLRQGNKNQSLALRSDKPCIFANFLILFSKSIESAAFLFSSRFATWSNSNGNQLA